MKVRWHDVGPTRLNWNAVDFQLKRGAPTVFLFDPFEGAQPQHMTVLNACALVTPRPLVQRLIAHVARPPHVRFIEVHLVAHPGDGHVISLVGHLQAPAFLALNGHTCQRRVDVGDGADGRGRR